MQELVTKNEQLLQKLDDYNIPPNDPYRINVQTVARFRIGVTTDALKRGQNPNKITSQCSHDGSVKTLDDLIGEVEEEMVNMDNRKKTA
mmetsp:Transcript_44539/g.67136  ORF Transcript_44539/g.67136 Transcript_44539/m.67136 type:complete len:89 (+) Transcript_44539:104-370(+)